MFNVTLNSDIIEVVNSGPKTPEEQGETIRQIQELSEKLRKENKPVLILDDISQMDIPSEALRRVGSNVEKMADFDKFALFASSAQMRAIVNFMILAGKETKLRVFENREQAIAWLKEDPTK